MGEGPDSIFWRKGWFYALAGTTSVIQSLTTERIHVSGLDNLEQKLSRKKGALWLGKHERKKDFYNLPPVWLRLQERISMRGISRSDYIQIKNCPAISKTLSRGLSVWMSILFHEVVRSEETEGMSEDQKKLVRENNHQSLAAATKLYDENIHVAAMAEGRTATDGTVYPAKRGAYALTRDDIQIVPFGVTYDSMSGSSGFLGRKDLVYVHFRAPFYHQKNGDHEQDLDKFRARIREEFLMANVITVEQLAGHEIHQLARNGNYKIKEVNLARMVKRRADTLQGLGLECSSDLFKLEDCLSRVHNFYQACLEEQYIFNGQVSPQRTLFVPSEKDFKRDNPLLYSVNRLHDVATVVPGLLENLTNQRLGPL